MFCSRLCGGGGRIYSRENLEMAAARDNEVRRISTILKPFVTDIRRHQDLHTIITYYDMKKDAHADPSVSSVGNKNILKPALESLMGSRIMNIIREVNTENTQYFFYALNDAMQNTIYTKVKKIGRLKKDNWENDKLENTLPSFIKYGIEESSRPKNFNKDITTYLSIASYLDPYPSREQTKKAFSYDYEKDEGDRIKISAGKTIISGTELKEIGVPDIASITGTINGYDWTCDTRINFEGSINPNSINNKFNPNFTESGTSDKEYQLGNPTKNKWISIKRTGSNNVAAIKKAKVYLLAKEVGDTCQVLLGNKLADELPKPETSPLGIFAVDTVVGMRTRLTKKMNAIIKNNGDTPLGGLFDEYNLYLCRDDPKTELLSIAQMIHKNTITYNNVIKQKYIDAYGTGFSIPSSRDIGPNHERLLDIFQRIVREINIKNALIYIMYQYLVGYIETFYLSDAAAAQAEQAAQAAQAAAEAAAAEAAAAAAAAAAEDPRIRDIPSLRSIYDASDIALLKADEYKRRGILAAAARKRLYAPAAAPPAAAPPAAAAAAAAAAPRIDIRVEYFNSCKSEIDKYEEHFKSIMKATDLFKHNSKQNTYKLAELEKYIFTDKTPFATPVKPVGTVLGELLGSREKYVRKAWDETKSYIESYTTSINRLTGILFPVIGAGAGADARARARAATPRSPPPGDGDGNDNNDNDDNDDNDDQPITRRNFLLLRDATAASAATTQAALAALAAQIAQFPRARATSLGSGEGAGAAAAASRAASRPGSAAAASSSATETARPPSRKRVTPAHDSSPTILPINASAAAAALDEGIVRPQAVMREDKEDEEDEEGTDPDRKKARLSLKDINIYRLTDMQVRELAGKLNLNGSGGGGGPGPSIDELKRRLIQYKKNQSGGARENWDELSGLEITDLMKMNENPNKFLKEKVYEFYGETKDEMYMFSLMNSIYHYLDYVNEITVDRDILDIIKVNYDDLNTLPLETLSFDNFKREYSEIKQQKIDQYKIVPIPSVNLRRRLFITRKILNKAKQEKAAEAVAAATAAAAAAVSPQGKQAAAAAAAADATALVTGMDYGAGGTVSDSGSVPQQKNPHGSVPHGTPGPGTPGPRRPAAAPVKAGEETQRNEAQGFGSQGVGSLKRGLSIYGGGSRKYRKTRKLRKGNV